MTPAPVAGQYRLLDLFCGAGGAAMGYHRGGFEVVGVDHKPQKHYPFRFIQADAMAFTAALLHYPYTFYAQTGDGVDCWKLEHFDAIHASPPCQAYSDLRRMWNAKEHPDLVGPTRVLLEQTSKPYIIENVPGAPLRATVMLCGTMFQLGVGDAELWRHRYFETTFSLGLTEPCSHYQRGRVIGVYGGHGRDRRRVVQVQGHAGGRSKRDGTQQFSTADRRTAMGIDWMTGEELSQAIPPAYTEYIGRQLMRHLHASP